MSNLGSSAMLPLLPPSPSLPPPPYSPLNMQPRSLRRSIPISAPQVLVEMLDSALKELAIAEEELAEIEAIKAALWTGPKLSWTSMYQEEEKQSEEYHDARLAVHKAEERVAWCEMKVRIALETAINPPIQFSGSVLLSASCVGNVDVVLALLEANKEQCIRVNVNEVAWGRTALSYAVQGPMPGSEKDIDNYVQIVKALLKAGADSQFIDCNGMSIKLCAISCGHEEIIAVLHEFGVV